MPQQTKGAWQPYNVSAIVKNVEQVFKKADIKYLNKPTYQFIINSMGFIAHYDLNGFKATYADLRTFIKRFTDSENYHLNWADSVEKDKQFQEWYGKPYNKSKADAMRGIITVARKYEKVIFEKFDEREKNEEISQAKALAEKHSFKLVKT